MRYLTSARINREDIHEYISSARQQLVGSLTRIEKHKEVENLTRLYNEEKDKLLKAKDVFEDDLQRFQSMKGDIESLHMIGNEQLTSKLEEVNGLNG